MSVVAAYIDGFNLYHGLKAKFGRRYLWLDLELLVERLTKPYQQVDLVRYFTASVRNDAAAQHRQSQYLGALQSHSTKVDVVMGRFQEKKMRCRTCSTGWTTYEEKETDVSIAVQLVEDGVNGVFDIALLISADSDLCPAVRALRRLRPSVQVVAAFPPKRRSDELRALVDSAYTIGEQNISQSLLPNSVGNRTTGMVYTRPRTWY